VPSIAESVGYSAALRESWSVTRTAAAEERGYVVRSEISSLGFTTPNHRVVVADLGYGIDGLLGNNQHRDPIRGPSHSRREDRSQRVTSHRHARSWRQSSVLCSTS
jgi:hypothetical protein